MDHSMPSNIEAKLDQILAALARIEGQTDLYCKGHPFQHTFVVTGGRCGHCGKMAMPQGIQAVSE
jgi:hypothetical protein